MWETNAEDVRPELWYDVLRVLAAMGYDPDGPDPDWTFKKIRPQSTDVLSAHRRLEAAARVEMALALNAPA